MDFVFPETNQAILRQLDELDWHHSLNIVSHVFCFSTDVMKAKTKARILVCLGDIGALEMENWRGVYEES